MHGRSGRPFPIEILSASFACQMSDVRFLRRKLRTASRVARLMLTQPAQERHVAIGGAYGHLRPPCTLLHLATLNVTTQIRVVSPELKIG